MRDQIINLPGVMIDNKKTLVKTHPPTHPPSPSVQHLVRTASFSSTFLAHKERESNSFNHPPTLLSHTQAKLNITSDQVIELRHKIAVPPAGFTPGEKKVGWVGGWIDR